MESLSPSVERAKRIVETCQKNYDCYIKMDMLGVFALSNAACARTLAEFALPNAKFAVEKAIGATLSILWSIADSVTCFVVNTPLLLSTTTKTVFSVFASGDVNKGRSVILIVVDISVPMILLKE
jgi:hypothetical protein